VLGAGFNHVYPKQNNRLALELLAAGGLLISEYPAEVTPRPYHFPERNRIISGLSEMTVLVEASEKSGSLITARLALEQGREVCAVPGPATSPLSAGCHRLIRQGAALVTNVSEVAQELGWSLSDTPALDHAVAAAEPSMTGLSAQICRVISGESKQFDEIVALVRSDPQQVSQCLMELQLSGFVRQGADGYIRVL
jgi:DNA processing protein